MAALFFPFRQIALILFFCCLDLSQSRTVDAAAASLKEKYDSLPPKGKFATGAFVGFVGAKAFVGSAVKAIKIGGAAFVASEVAHSAGLFKDLDMPDYVDDLVDEVRPFLPSAKRKLKTAANEARLVVRQKISPANIKANLEAALMKERMATLGAAAGAFVGFAL